MPRVYFHHEQREECRANGMWRVVSNPLRRTRYITAAAALLRNQDQFLTAACRVIDEWPNSTLTILSAPGMNHRAWIGWAASYLVTGAPEDCTRLGWHDLTESEQQAANYTADLAIEIWHGRQRAIAAEGMLFDLGESA